MIRHITYRVSVKYGAGWFIAYEGSDYKWVVEIQERYKDRKVAIERI